MTEAKAPPFVCHVLVCTNRRDDGRSACGQAPQEGVEIRDALRQGVVERRLRPKARISQTGCLGVCVEGPNVMIYPQKLWFARVTLADVPAILDRIAEIVAAS